MNSWVGIAFLFIGMVVGGIGSIYLGLSLLAFMAFIGGMELAMELSHHKRDQVRIPVMGPAGLLSSAILYVGVGVALWAVMWTMKAQPGCDLAMQMLQG